jgi:hypothetical protein
LLAIHHEITKSSHSSACFCGEDGIGEADHWDGDASVTSLAVLTPRIMALMGFSGDLIVIYGVW